MTPRPVAARRLLVLVGLLAGLVLAGPAAPASAHAFLDTSVPADGAVLDRAPGELRMQFSESVVTSATRIDIVDADGHHSSPTGLRLEASADPEEPVSLVAALPVLTRNAYRVSWETLSSDDLHRTSGILVFGVGAAVTTVAPVEPLPRADEAGLRWLVFLGLSLALGGGLAGRLYRRQAGPVGAAAAGRAGRWAAAGALAAAAISVGLLVDQLAGAGGAGRRLLLGAYGERWLLRELGLGALVLAALGSRRGRHRPANRLLWCAGTAAATCGSALLGHAGATGSGASRVLADAAHLTATAVWAGALVVLAGGAAVRLSAGPEGRTVHRAALRAFGRPAALCVGVTAATGVYLTSGLVGSVDAALLTVYGRVLLLKLVVVAVVAVLGLVNAVRLRRPPAALPRRTVLVEATAAVVVLLLAAVLTSGQPALEPALVRAAPANAASLVDGQVGDLQETLALGPNRPGRNVAVIGVLNTRRPALAPIGAVDISVLEADGRWGPSIAAEPLADGHWSAPVTLAAAGATQVRVRVLRPGLADLTRAYSWTVGRVPTATRATVVSQAPLSGPLRALSAGLAVLVLLAGLALWVGRRGRSRPAAGAGPRAPGSVHTNGTPVESLSHVQQVESSRPTPVGRA